jgi:hypothetical protein
MANIATITDNIISALSGTTSQVLLGDATLTDFKLDSLTDVNVPTPGDGDVLRWNATTSLWEASDSAGITGSGTAGQVAYFTSTNVQGGSNNLFWDITNSRLGIGTNTFNDNLNPYKTVITGVPNGSGGGGLMVTNNQNVNASNAFISAINWSTTDGTNMKPAGFFYTNAINSHAVRIGGTGNLMVRTNISAANLTITNQNLYISHIDQNSTGNTYINSSAHLYVQRNSGTVNVNSYVGYLSTFQTAVASETIGTIADFQAGQQTLNGASTITTRYAVLIDYNNTNITNAWGIYQSSSTINNYMNGELLIGSTTDTGEKLQVTGTAKITGATSFGGNMTLSLNQNAATVLNVSNTTSGTSSLSYYRATSSNGTIDFGKFTATTTAYRIINANDGFISNSTVGDIAILNGNATGTIKFAAGDSSTVQMLLSASGNLGVGTSTPNSRLEAYSATGYNVIRSVGASGGYFETYSTAGVRQGSFGSESNGDTYFGSRSNNPLIALTNGTEVGRFFSNGNFKVGAASSDNGQKFQVIGTSYFSDSVGIGTTSLTGSTLSLFKNITGNAISYGVYQFASVQSDVTGQAHFFRTLAATQATTFILGELFHYRATQSTFGAGSTVNVQYGYSVDNLTGATNNYGFYGNIAAATGRWNLYMNGTANNYMAGALGIGNAGLTGINLRISRNHTGATSSYGIYNEGAVLSDVTNSAAYFQSVASTQAATFTVPNLRHFIAVQSTFGAGSTVTNQSGYFVASSLVGAANNYGFFGDIPAGTNRWNLYMGGTANNYFAGSLGIGTGTLTGAGLRVSKPITGLYISSGGSYGVGIVSDGMVMSDEVGGATFFRTFAQTEAAAFTAGGVTHFEAVQGNIGVGSAISTQVGFFARETLIGATSNYGFYGNIPSGTNRFNLYMNGSANNYLGGNTGIGNGSPARRLEVASDGTNWISGTFSGAGGGNKVVLGNLSGVATIGTHNAALTGWGALGINTGGGNVLIGTTTDSGSKLQLQGDFSVTGYISLAATNTLSTSSFLYKNASNRLYYGRNRVRGYIERNITGVSTDPTAYNTYYEIGSAAFASLEGSFEIDVTFAGSGYGQSAKYILPVSYAMDYLSSYTLRGVTTYAGVWMNVQSVYSAPRHLMPFSSNWELQVKIDANTIAFRIVIRGGSTGTCTAFVKINHSNDFDGVTWTEQTGTGLDATVYETLNPILSSNLGTSTFQNNLSIGGNLSVGATTALAPIYAVKDGGANTIRLFLLSNSNPTYSQNVFLDMNTSKDVLWGQGSAGGGTFWNSGTRGYGFSINGTSIATFNTSSANINGLTVGRGTGNLITNSAFGAGVLTLNTTGFGNLALGYFSLYNNTTGYYNLAAGYDALYGNTEGFENVGVGFRALYSNTTGDDNIAIGYRAGFGGSANANTTGNNNIFIGTNIVGVAATDSNRTFIGSSSTTSTWLGGNLLLGSTTDGGERIQVTGTAKFTSSSGAAPDIIMNNTAGGSWLRMIGAGTPTNIIDSNGTLIFRNGSTYTTKLTLDTSGNLLLGTAAGTSTATPVSMSLGGSYGNSTAGSTANMKLKLYDDTVDTNHYGFGVSANLLEISAPSSIAFFNGVSASRTERMRINANGRVLIGSVSDTGETFQVTGTARVTSTSTFGSTLTVATGANARIALDTASTDSSSRLQFNENTTIKALVQYVNSTFATVSRRNRLELGGTTGGISFTVNSVYDTPAVLIDGSGNVGIGVAAPTYKLQVYGDTLFTNSSGLQPVYFGKGVSVNHTHFGTATDGDFALIRNGAERIRFVSAWTQLNGRLVLSSDTGNVQIGSSTDNGQKLQVTGTANITGNTEFGGAVSMGTNVFTGGVMRVYSSAIPVVSLQNSTTTTGNTNGFQFSVSGANGYIWNYQNAAIFFGTNATERMRIKPEGHVRFVPLTTAPTTNVEAGDVYYNSTDNKHYGYNGTTWNAFY